MSHPTRSIDLRAPHFAALTLQEGAMVSERLQRGADRLNLNGGTQDPPYVHIEVSYQPPKGGLPYEVRIRVQHLDVFAIKGLHGIDVSILTVMTGSGQQQRLPGSALEVVLQLAEAKMKLAVLEAREYL